MPDWTPLCLLFCKVSSALRRGFTLWTSWQFSYSWRNIWASFSFIVASSYARCGPRSRISFGPGGKRLPWRPGPNFDPECPISGENQARGGRGIFAGTQHQGAWFLCFTYPFAPWQIRMRRYDDDPPFFRVVYPHCTRSLQSGRRADILMRPLPVLLRQEGLILSSFLTIFILIAFLSTRNSRVGAELAFARLIFTAFSPTIFGSWSLTTKQRKLITSRSNLMVFRCFQIFIRFLT